jgi:zinc protease
MKTPRTIGLWLALLALGFLSLTAAAPRFAHETSDLKPDTAARYGVLPNGVRYVVLHNAEPKGRASLRLLVGAGSLYEEDDQRGVAHFLEHMAFNGSKNYAPGTLVEVFQRLGMNFGGDTNASTGFDRTLYLLELPETTEKVLAEGMKVFADYAGGLLLSAAEIDKERGVILSEKRARDSIGMRTMEAQFGFMLGDTLLPRRMPIGTVEVIQSAPRERFVAFWDKWYRPDNVTAIIVGDVDVALAEKTITAAFSGLQPRASAPTEPDRGRVAVFTGVRAGYHYESEAPATDVSIAVINPYRREPDTAATRVERLPRSLAIAMLNRRFSVLVKKEGAPFSGARASFAQSYRVVREGSIDLECKPGQWKEALAVGEQELRRALEHGFRASELKEAVANTVNSLERAVQGAATRRSSALAGEIAQGVLDDRVFTTPAADLALLKPALEKITPEQCTAALREAFSGNGRFVMVSGNVKIEGDAAAAITAAYDAAKVVKVEPPPADKEAVWAYANFGQPGKVVKRETVADLGLTLVAFENGVRVNLKPTDFEAGRIHVSVRIGTGVLTEPKDKRGLAMLANATFSSGGLGKHSTDDLRQILAGRTAGAGFRVGSDAIEMSFPAGGGGGRGGRGGGAAGTTRADLPLTLQLMTAYVTDPGYRPEALRLARISFEQMYASFEHTSNGPFSTEVANLIAGGDPRFGVPAKEVMMARTLDEVRAWLAPQLAKGAIEIALAGDLDLDAAIDAVAKTFGALPAREAKPALAEERRILFPAQPFTRSFTVVTEIAKGEVALYWPTTDALDVKRTRRMTMLASVFSDRLRVKIREDMGGTYSPRAMSSASDTFPGYGYITTMIDVAPEMADKIAEAAIALADDIAKNGVTEEELNRARLPALTAARESTRTNAYWMGSVLARAQEKPEVVGWARTRLPDLEAMTAAELSALAKQYLGRDRASRVTVLPKKS